MMRTTLILASFAVLGACAGAYRDGGQPTTRHLGHAVDANSARMVESAQSAEGTTDGERAARAVNAYRENAATQTAAPTASDVGAY